MREKKLMIVGHPAPFHVGAHFRHAARRLGLAVELCDANEAYRAPAWQAKLNWWCRGRRPSRLRAFGRAVVEQCRLWRPRWLLATGIAPLARETLIEIGRLGIRRLNYLTDDPWNPAHRAPWFMRALPDYDIVLSTRRANMDQLTELGCRRVHYLPFAYAPEIHFREPPSAEERPQFQTTVLFAGGADRDRFPWVRALIRAGVPVALYGGYWDRDPETRPFHRGHADPKTLRKATAGAQVVLGLVRHANRDGHAMRSFEVPAMGGCLLTEDTAEHREIFGGERQAVTYFRGVADMLEKVAWLSEHEAERRRLTENAYTLITRGGHTYADRLHAMLELAGV